MLGVDTRERRREPFAAAEAPPAVARTGPGWRTVSALALGLGLLGGTAGAFAVLQQRAPAPVPQAQILAAPAPPASAPIEAGAGVDVAPLQAALAALTARLTQIEETIDAQEGAQAALASHGRRLVALEAAPPRAEAAQLAIAVAALQERMDTVEAERAEARALRRLEARLAAQAEATRAETAALRAELAAAGAAAAAAEGRAAAALQRARLVFAFMALTEAAQGSAPFPEAHAALARSLPASPHAAALGPLAQTGAPSRPELTASFAATAEAVERALRQQQGTGAGLFGQVQAALAEQVSVRPVAPKGLPQSRLDAARAALAQQDLGPAAAALSLLSGPAAAAAKPWLDAARRRLEIERRLAAIRAELSEG